MDNILPITDRPRIRIDAPTNHDCKLVVVKDKTDCVIAYIAITKSGTLITLEHAGERLDCTLEDVTPTKTEIEHPDRFAPKPKRWPNGDKIKKGES